MGFPPISIWELKGFEDSGAVLNFLFIPDVLVHRKVVEEVGAAAHAWGASTWKVEAGGLP